MCKINQKYETEITLAKTGDATLEVLVSFSFGNGTEVENAVSNKLTLDIEIFDIYYHDVELSTVVNSDTIAYIKKTIKSRYLDGAFRD